MEQTEQSPPNPVAAAAMPWSARIAFGLLFGIAGSELVLWPAYRLLGEGDALLDVLVRGSPLAVHGLAAIASALLLWRRPLWGSVLGFLVAFSSASCLSCAWFGSFLPGEDGPLPWQRVLLVVLAVVHVSVAVLVAVAGKDARARQAAMRALVAHREQTAPETF